MQYVEFTKGYGGAGIITVLGISRKGTGVATGIENIENRPSASAVNGIYTINGMKINTLQKGINIIKMADGATRKVVINFFFGMLGMNLICNLAEKILVNLSFCVLNLRKFDTLYILRTYKKMSRLCFCLFI